LDIDNLHHNFLADPDRLAAAARENKHFLPLLRAEVTRRDQ
jgi:hypothetical protein